MAPETDLSVSSTSRMMDIGSSPRIIGVRTARSLRRAAAFPIRDVSFDPVPCAAKHHDHDQMISRAVSRTFQGVVGMGVVDDD